MLVLSRKLGQSLVLGDDIRITIVKIDRNTVRVGVEAPRNVKVLREEVVRFEDMADHNEVVAPALASS